VLRCTQMIQPIQERPKRPAVSTRSAVNHVFCILSTSRLRKKKKSGILWPDMGYNARCVTRCGGTSDARWRCQERGAVQLFELRKRGCHWIIRCGPIQKIVDEALGALTGEFQKLYAKFGRPSISA